MVINRRDFLQNIGVQIPAAVAMPSLSLAGPPYKSFQLFFSDITAATPPDMLFAVLEPFVNAHIPVSCVLSMQNDAEMANPDSATATFLRRIIADHPAQIEVILEVPTLTEKPSYFQSRMATQARHTLEHWLVSGDFGHHLARSILTLANFGDVVEYNSAGMRAAGFRTVLCAPRSGVQPADSRWIDGTLHLLGGMHLGLTDPIDTIEQALIASVNDDPRTLLILSLAGLSAANLAEDVARITEFASLVSVLSRTGQIVPTTPSNFHFRSTTDANTVIGLRLDVPGKPDDPVSAAALELAKWLRATETPFTVAGQDAQFWHEGATHLCHVVDQSVPDDQNPCRIPGDGNFEHLGASALPPRIAMTDPPIIDPIAGVDQNATLHPPRLVSIDDTISARQFISDMTVLEDTVLVLDQGSYGTVAQRAKTTAKIDLLNRRRSFEITDVAGFAERTQALDSIQRVYHQTREVMHREKAALASYDRLDRDPVKNDARLAWQYFQRFRNPRTGLMPSTAFLIGRDITRYDYATMWDVGSQILGMIAAVELDLMTLPEMTRWAERLIVNLPTVTLQGLRLPSSIVHVGNREAPDQSFTTCDVGRLLSSFDNLRTFSAALRDIIDSKVAGWDIQQTIQDGRMQDLTITRRHDRFISHCSDYSARAYAAFGVAADSPLVALNETHNADDMIALLYSASRIGSIGAEPLLLEGIEMGFSPTSQYLADMLFAAQLEDNRNTGTMRCVSEAPLDQEPWFTYQGYRINNFAQPWSVQVRSNDAKYASPDFLKSIQVVSVKAAFLWAATHPHDYSNALVNYVRARARVEGFGFSSGIYLETGLPMQEYSDLNTNAIILQAAAAILKT